MIDQIVADILKEIKRASDSVDPSKLRPLIESIMRKANLVSREEFDAQQKVLARTREKLEELEQKVAKLEAENP